MDHYLDDANYSTTAAAATATAGDSKPEFECNICLETVRDPVVTLCGHLYCWPCIYRWILNSRGTEQIPQCPVCKKEAPEESLIPIFGRGRRINFKNEPSGFDSLVPQRPGRTVLRDYGSSGFRNPDEPYSGRSVYGYSGSVYEGPPRLRRWLKEADRSLSRVFLFLCCCVFMCLLLF